ncbi:hypothetical protein GCM10027028_59550 [Streptomyces sundarbansensis]
MFLPAAPSLTTSATPTPFGPLQVDQSSIGAVLRSLLRTGAGGGNVRRDPMAYKVVPPGCPTLSYPP